MYELFSNLMIEQLKKHIDYYQIDSEGEKWLISYYGDTSLNQAFDKIISLCNDQIHLDINGKAYPFKVIQYEDKTVIPCRVKNKEGGAFEHLTPNYCSREFNGKLRDFFYFNEGKPVSNRILLTFDNEPVETQKASRILTAPRQPLHYNQLIKGIEENIRSNFSGPIQEAARNVLSVWKNEVELIEENELEKILTTLNKTAEAAEDTQLHTLGQELSNLDVFLPATGMSKDSFASNKLKENIKLKKEIDNMFSPEVLVERELEESYEPGFAEKLIEAYRSEEKSLYDFKFENLIEHKLVKIDTEERLKILSVEFEDAKLVKEQAETQGTSYLLKAGSHRSSIKVTIEFNRDLTKESIHASTGNSGIKISPNKMVGKIKSPEKNNTAQFNVSIDSIGVGHYGFCAIDVKSGTRSTSKSFSELKFAVVKAEEEYPVFYEQSLQFDVQYQAFTASGLDDVICLLEKEDRQQEEVLMISDVSEPIKFEGTRRLRFQDIVHEDGIEVTLNPSWEDQEFYLPLWLEPTGKEESVQEVNSIFEILLEDRKQFIREQGGDQKWSRPDLRVDGETIFFRGRKQSLGGKFSKYLSIEKEMLEHPATLIWQGEFGVDSRTVSITAHPMLDDLPEWNLKAFHHYIQCRESFFVRLLEKGVNSLLLSFFVRDEELLALANQYVASYVQLCNEISIYNKDVKEEYQYSIYTDLIELDSYESEELLISPTHPLHVAYLIELGNKVEQWLQEKDQKFVFGERDFQRLGTSDYIPLIQFKQKWYKIIESDFIAWNRYQVAERKSEDHQVESYVARVFSDKLMQFIEYHPIIFAPRTDITTLYINVFNPGDGKFVLDALREFYRQSRNRENTPKLHLNLIGSGKVGTLLDLTFSIEGVPEGFPQINTENEVFQHIRERVSYTKQTHEESLPYAHLTFVINEFQSDVRGEALLNSFQSSVYGEGLIPKVSRKVKGIEKDDTTKTYLSALWINEEMENKEYGTMAYISRVLQEQYHSLDGILKKYEARMQKVDVKPSKLKEEMYKKSRWVVHLDREIGLEVFKSELIAGHDRPIILDYSNQYNPQKAGYDVITTTLQVKPYISRVKRILDLSTEEQANKAISILNNLSGRWALNLVRTNDTNVAERIGNVVTFQYLKLIEKVFDQSENHFSVIVSLEEFLRVNRNIGLPTDKGWVRDLGSYGQYSDDLLLVTLYRPNEGEDLRVELRVIEVKFGSSSLKKGKDQVHKTHDLLATRFGKTGLTDEMFRAMDFANLVLDGIDKAIMYGLMDRNQLSAMKFDEEIFPRLISNQFKLYTNGTFKGERYKGDVINISKEGQNYLAEFMDGVRVITIPNKYFIPLLEEDGDLLNELTSEFAVRVMEHSTFGLEPEVTSQLGNDQDTEENEEESEEGFEPDVPDQLNEEEHVAHSEPGDLQDNNEEQPVENSETEEIDNEQEILVEEKINSEVALLIGEQVGTDKPIYWDHRRKISNPLANHNIIITGDPGKGKTQTTKGLIHEIRSNHIPLLAFDFKDDYIDEEFLEAERMEKFDIMIDGLPFNPLVPYVDPNQGYFLAINQIIQIEGIIKRIYSLGPQQSTQFRTAIIEAFKRKRIEPNLPNYPDRIEEYPTFVDVHNILLEDEKKHGTLLGRIDLLFQLNLFRNESKLTFEELMAGSYTLRLSQLPINEIKAAIAEMIILAIHNYLLAKEQPRRLTRAVVLDEAHRVSQSKALLELMREGRAFGIGMMIATQFPTDIAQDIYGCTETKLFLSNDQFNHAESAAKQIEGGSPKLEINALAEEIRNMKQFRAVLRNSQYSKVFLDIVPYYKR
ncbi:ATP-binding protein [Bacillus sp. 7884-1]|uniref:ATP-binding protein n=1 Tax=Bacillus sp. 7884-1 TaxID=2021693 RepID=UPI000BA7C9CE|nr:ATP-binding protein [Bacillus sp. 7884-1]PAE37519.1 hypothetical protein CHI06_20155 [Bacillus sp. 7884-1]